MCKVLVIDDEKGILQLISQALARFGHKVVTAGDGQEGIDKFDGDKFDIVITDMCMPGVDGNGVVKHIRNSRKPFVPVIAISGTPWHLNSHHFDMVLTKPFPLKKLVESVDSLDAMPAGAAVAM